MELASEKAAFITNQGDSITIIRQSGNLQTTARIMAMKRRTGFFSINYLREALFVPGCGIQRGDLILNTATNEQFFIEGYQNKTRGGVISSVNAELYMVNYPNVQVQRLTQTYDANGNPLTSTWNPIATAPMNVEHVNGNTQYHDGLLLVDTVFKLTLQTTTALQLMDRILLDGKPYEVSDVNLSVIPNLQVVQVKVDNRT